MSQLTKESNEKETSYFSSSFGGDVVAFQLPQKKTLKKSHKKRVPTTKVVTVSSSPKVRLHQDWAFLRSKINCAKSSIL